MFCYPYVHCYHGTFPNLLRGARASNEVVAVFGLRKYSPSSSSRQSYLANLQTRLQSCLQICLKTFSNCAKIFESLLKNS